MHLKQIKLAGFKSFVDPTIVPFSSNMTAIVGPNGCGKSNVIDAVRWVMGESSAKNLRGQAMTDVIFNGSSSRKPIGQASIELVFDNTDAGLGGEYANYNEIAIKRTVNRDALSNYYLNGIKCRRRDITDVFLGTGLGPRSYSIIEQGMISKLIESKPQELRLFIEEAAGISKYKERRRETETRIRHTRENLERLNDIREELEKRIALLSKQAKAAEQYKEYKQQERELTLQLHALNWRHFNQHVHEHTQQIEQLEDSIMGARTQIDQANAHIESFKIDQMATHDLVQQYQSRFYQYGEQIARLEQAIQHNQATGQRIAREMADIQSVMEDIRVKQTQDAQEIEILHEQQATTEEALEWAQAEIEQMDDQTLSYEDELRLCLTDWNDCVENLNLAQQKSASLQAQIQFNESSLTRLEQEVVQYTQDIAHFELDESALEVEQIAEQLAEETLRVDELSYQIEQDKTELTQLRVQKVTAEQSLKQISLSFAQTSAQVKSLQQLLADLNRVGSDEHAWIEQNGYQESSPLLSHLQVDECWMPAVEWFLARELNFMALTQLPQVPQLQTHPLNLGFIQESAVHQTHDMAPIGVLQPLASLFQPNYNLHPFTHNVFICDTLIQATQQLSHLKAEQCILTQDGYYLGHGFICCFTGKQQQGQLQLNHRIEIAKASLLELEAEYQAAEDHNKQLQELIQSKQQQLDEWQNRYHQSSRQQAHQQAHLASKQQALQEKTARHQRLQDELAKRLSNMDSLSETVALCRAELSQFLDDMQNFSADKELLAERKRQLEANLLSSRQTLSNKKNQCHQLQLTLSQLKHSIQNHQNSQQQLQSQQQHFEQRLQDLSQQHQQEGPDVSELRENLECLLAERLDIETVLNQHKEQWQLLSMQLTESEKVRLVAEQQIQAVQDKLGRLKLDCEGYKIRRESHAEQLTQADSHIDVVLQALPEEAEVSVWEQQLAQMAAKINRLGAINLVAIDEFATETERKNYLDAQNQDLLDALETLEGAIRKIDRETRTKFKETFDKVNDGLQFLFPKVFGGGAAYLELTEHDLLETGVGIMARPPGKKNSTIHLLSGGEKALTAMALVFAIFQLNPAPFCMLDEVDAPLDDANVGRFCNLVKSMADRVQFIFITHNKVAMEMAEQLMGVTMQEPGVSRLVAVDIEEAAAMAAS